MHHHPAVPAQHHAHLYILICVVHDNTYYPLLPACGQLPSGRPWRQEEEVARLLLHMKEAPQHTDQGSLQVNAMSYAFGIH